MSEPVSVSKRGRKFSGLALLLIPVGAFMLFGSASLFSAPSDNLSTRNPLAEGKALGHSRTTRPTAAPKPTADGSVILNNWEDTRFPISPF